jgi:aerobic-type carbon monoxide dehydrogenase small subunit (CoxS/CutS family)
MQCGFCRRAPCDGQALLDKNPNPTEDEIRSALRQHLICGTYPRHAKAILEAAAKMSKGA